MGFAIIDYFFSINYGIPNYYHNKQFNSFPPTFTEEEWEERKKYRSYDLVQFGYGTCGNQYLTYFWFRFGGREGKGKFGYGTCVRLISYQFLVQIRWNFWIE